MGLQYPLVDCAYGLLTVHPVGNSLAFAYIPPRFAVAGTALEVVIPGQPRPARILGKEFKGSDPLNL